VWSECKQLWEEGLQAYVRQWWNWLDFIMLSLYLCTFSLRAVAYMQISTGK
jgi:transient receptor potential cation channel subfamily C member 4